MNSKFYLLKKILKLRLNYLIPRKKMALFNLSEFMTIGILNKSKNPVFRLQSISTGQEYVLKKLQRYDFQAHLSDFAELTYILRCCHHPNIIKILGFSMNYINYEYTLCFLMDMYKTDLQKLIDVNRKNEEHIGKKQLIKIIKGLIEALNFMQTQIKIAHRDLKPANILLDSNNNPIITDFSEAYFAEGLRHNQYREDGIKGTPEYMSPELKQLFMGSDPDFIHYNPWVSDVYSLGVTLINLACSFSNKQLNSLSEKIQLIEGEYGKEVRAFLEILVKENQEERGDFKSLILRKEFKVLIDGSEHHEDLSFSSQINSENANQISVILEDDDVEEDESFGRKVDLKTIQEQIFSLTNIEIEENYKKKEFKNSISMHFHRDNRKFKGSISDEMKKLKEVLKIMKNHENEKLNGDIIQVFRNIVINIKELEFENRLIRKDIKNFYIKKSASMMNFINNGNFNKDTSQKHKKSVGASLNELVKPSPKKSINIAYKMEKKN